MTRDELVIRESELTQELSSVKLQLRDLAIKDSGFSVGDEVRHKKTGQIFRVTHINPQSWGPTWLRGVVRRKDGTWGTGIKHLFDYVEKVQP